MNPLKDHVSNPLTPAQSKAQVVDAAREIVSTLGLKVTEAWFWHSSCNDDGVAPFRGEVRISYPPAPSFEQSDAEVGKMIQHLRSTGWKGDPDFHTHGSMLRKDNIVVVFDPQNASTPNRTIELHGECRDVTTTKETKGPTEAIAFG